MTERFTLFKCSKCGAGHNRFRGRFSSVPQSYCAKCHAENMRRTRPKHSGLPTESRLKANARAYANVYQRRGALKKEPCEACGKPAEKHHDDYSEPLKVRWLCRECHLDHHYELGEKYG